MFANDEHICQKDYARRITTLEMADNRYAFGLGVQDVRRFAYAACQR
jgi:hypothetical protein